MADQPFYQRSSSPPVPVPKVNMAGGAGFRGYNGGGNQPPQQRGGQNQGGPGPQHYNNPYPAGPQRQQQAPSQCGGPAPPQQQGQPEKPRSGGFDGPGEPQRGQNPYGPGLGYDPAKPKPVAQKVITNTRIELPASAYKLEGGNVS